MKNRPITLLVLVVSVGGLLLTEGCSSATKRKWLSFFFDGVPPETSASSTPTGSANGSDTNAVQPGVVVTKPARFSPPTPVIHKPFEENKCTKCHQSEFSMELVAKPPKLCFNCHKDFLATARVKHQPVENGECKSCHDPHQS